MSRPRPSGWWRHTPLLLLLLVLLLSVVMALTAAQFVREQQETRFDRESETHLHTLEARLKTYENLLKATRASWVNRTEMPGLAEFARVVGALEVARHYPGVQGLGYALWLPDGLNPAATTNLRRKVSPGYAVHPAAAPEQALAPVALLAPLNSENRATLGFDMYSEAQRRLAFDRAARHDAVQATAAVTLLQRDSQGQPLRGFLLMLPVWPSTQGGQRPAQPEGYLYLVVRADDFLQALNGPYTGAGLSIRTELGGGALGASTLSGTPPYHQVRTLTALGQTWRLTYAAGPQFGRDSAAIIPLLTLLLGVLVAGFVYRLSDAQVRSRLRAEELNGTLLEARAEQAQSRAEFEAIFESMQDAAVFTDGSGHVRRVNRALNDLFRIPEGALSGQPIETLHLDRRLVGRATFQALTTPYRRADGTVFSGEAQRSEVHGPGGELLGLLEVVRDVTERVEAERALQLAERRSRDVLDAIPHVIWVVEASGEHTFVNEKHQRLVGEDFRRSLNAEDQPHYDDMWARARTTQTAAQCEVRLNVRGTPRWHLLKVTPILDDAGQPREWVASATDIHDRLVAERLAQRSEQRYRGVLEGMPQIVWLTDARGAPTYFNARWDEYVGHERAGYTFLKLLHPDERADYARRWAQAVGARLPFEAEHRLLGANGEYRTFVTRGLPILDTRGEVLEWVGTSTDVDDSVYAETSARLLADVSERLTSREGEGTGGLGSRYSAALGLLTARFAQGATLWAGSDAVPLATSRAHGGLNVPELAAQVERVRRSGEALYSEQAELLAELESVEGMLLPLPGSQGDAVGVLGLCFRRALHDRDHELAQELAGRFAVALDNDGLRLRAEAAQAELQALNQSLEERVHRRTEELQDAVRELEAFSYSVSHDLRTPLRHIVGFGDLLRKETGGTLSAKGERYLSVITDASAKMSQLIDDLLQFSRMGRQELRSVPVNLREVVEASWQGLDPDRAGRDIAFTLGDLPTVEGDPNLLGLVFTNLLGNAIKYTRTRERAHISVEAVLHGEGQDERSVTVCIRDDGVGFDPRYTDKLFGVFQRLHRAEEFEGIGIGLANVRRIVTRHGGSVHAEGRPGVGATFSVTLPLTRRETPA